MAKAKKINLKEVVAMEIEGNIMKITYKDGSIELFALISGESTMIAAAKGSAKSAPAKGKKAQEDDDEDDED